MADIVAQLANEFNLKTVQVQNTINLIDDGNTIPFISRYRKEMTGELNDQVLRELYDRLVYLRNLKTRREEVRRLIFEAGKLTDEIESALTKASILQEIEDIYRPFRPKRRTRAEIAREKGLEPLSKIIFAQSISSGSIDDISTPFINTEKGVNSIEEALDGAMDIIAETISDNPNYRKHIREIFFNKGVIMTKAKKEEDSEYRMYYDFKEPIINIANHRVLAINRGEKEEYLQVKILVPEEDVINYLKVNIISKNNPITREYVERAVEDASCNLGYQKLFPQLYPLPHLKLPQYYLRLFQYL
jgi:uncharacterized protein